VADEYPFESPPWWRDLLVKKLQERRRLVDLLDRYYEDGGRPPQIPPSVTGESRQTYAEMARLGVMNWCGVVADAPATRLAVVGFRSGSGEAGDEKGWDIWQRNQLDADHGLAHQAALKTGQSFALIWPGEGDRAEITLEDPSQMIVAYQSGSRRKRVAALKSWVDEGKAYAVLYHPTGVYKWRASVPTTTSERDVTRYQWKVWHPQTDAAWPVKNPYDDGTVPVVEIRANPRLRPSRYGGGLAEFAKVITDQDRINKRVFDSLVTGEYLGFPQRYIKGWEIPKLPDGTPDRAAVKSASQRKVWTFEDENVGVGQFPAADFSPFIRACEFDITGMMSITFTPPYYHSFGDMVNVSAESVKAIESGFVSKVQGHALNFGEAWEEVMNLALRLEGGPDDPSSSVIWRDVENRTWSQTVDAIQKMKDLGVPQEALWAMLPGVTPQEIRRWKAMAEQEALEAAMNTPPALQPFTGGQPPAPGQPPAEQAPPAPPPAPVGNGVA
jgi:hypothetical protein